MFISALAATIMFQSPQDEPNNLVLAKGTKTVPLGKVGKSLKVGTGPINVIVLPGAPFDGETWRPFMERNGKDYTFHALTPAGYGTDPPEMPTEEIEEPVWTNGFLDGVESYIKDNKIDKPILLAHHLMSDLYAVRLAERKPEAYRGIYVVFGQLRMVVSQTNGQATKLTREERISTLKERWVPFYKTVTDDVWRLGTFQPPLMSNNEKRAQTLFDMQVSVPIPIQLRYFLEYGCFDMTNSIGSLKVPIHALDKPVSSWDAVYENAIKQAKTQLGTDDDAEAQKLVDEQIEAMFGSIEVARHRIEAPIWQTALSEVDNVTFDMPKTQTLFSFLDAPDEFDQLFQKFIRSLKD